MQIELDIKHSVISEDEIMKADRMVEILEQRGRNEGA